MSEPPASAGGNNVDEDSEEGHGISRLHTMNVFSNILLRNGNSVSNDQMYTGRLLDNYLRLWLDYNPLEGPDDLDNSSDDSSDEDYDESVAEADLASDVQSNERLLLSSARQNPTNMNTLIPISEGPNLSRYGAIYRSRDSPRLSGFSRTLKDVEIPKLYNELTTISFFLKRLDGYPGVLPLYRNHGLHRRVVSFDQTHDLSANLDSMMDDFLKVSSSGRLWRCVENCNVIKSSMLTNTGFKRKNSWDVSFSSFAPKRRKMGTVSESGHICNSFAHDKDILHKLSDAQKHMIMNITFSSFFKAGSSFNLSNKHVSPAPISFTVSSLDYESKNVLGFFTLFGGDSHNSLDELNSLRSYEKYFMGLSSRDPAGSNDKFVLQALGLLESIDALINDLEVPLKQKAHSFVIPANGKMIDFKKNDLRFLPKFEVSNDIPRRSLHLARAKSNRVRIQCMEWMKIEPFSQFKISFFLQNLKKARISLQTYKTQSATQQKETAELARGIRNDLYDLTKDFSFLGENGKSIPLIEEQRLNRSHSFTKYRRTFFIQDWEKRLTDKMTRILTCEDNCLINLHLNFMLFTLTVDLTVFLKKSFEYKLQYVTEAARKKIRRQYEKLLQLLVGDCRFVVLICSINRKTGAIQIQNTRSYLQYKQVYSGIIYNDFRFDEAGSDDVVSLHNLFDNIGVDEPSDSDSNSLPQDWVDHLRSDPYNEESINTILTGGYLFKQNTGKVAGGGNQIYSIL